MARAVVYRRSKQGWGPKRWHFCQNCHFWPHDRFDEIRYEPPRDRCRECERLSSRGACAGPGWFA